VTRTERAATALGLALLALIIVGCGPSRPDPVVVAADSQVVTGFRDELGGSFVPLSVKLKIDGQLVGSWKAEGASVEELRTGIELPARVVPAGEHEASVHARYRGEGHGIFSYLKEYKFDVKSKHTFRAPPLGAIAITAVCFEKGGPATELSDRPSIRWIEETR
jgi:hypothetical protein